MFRKVFTFKRLFNFKGRSTRRELLLFHGLWIAISILPILIGDVSSSAGSATSPSAFAGAAVVVGVLLFWIGFVPILAVDFRRLHDQGNSGAFLLLGLVPLVGWIFLLIMMLYPGQRYDNDYGPDPREPDLNEDDNLETVFS